MIFSTAVPIDRSRSLDDSPSRWLAAAGMAFAVAMLGCGSSYKTCEDMYVECQTLGGGCTRGYPGCDVYGKASCGTCLECCQAGIPYPPKCKCRKCGFE